jgi:hypothetical protein
VLAVNFEWRWRFVKIQILKFGILHFYKIIASSPGLEVIYEWHWLTVVG